jgi:hypothetical protein
MQGRGYIREPFSPRRRATADAMRMARELVESARGLDGDEGASE